MKNKLGLIICSVYYKELSSILKYEKIDDVIISCIPSSGQCPNSSDLIKIEKICNNLKLKTDSVTIIPPNFCVGNPNKFDSKCYCLNNKLQNCLEMILPKSIINQYIEDGLYLLTPGWIHQWKTIAIKKWAFNKEIAKLFFKETAKQILVLDTGLYHNYTKTLNEFSDFSGLHYSIVKIGNEFFHNFIMNLYLKWKLENTKNEDRILLNESKSKLSEYAMAFDLMQKSAKINSEEILIKNIFEMIQMLFAPGNIYYIPIINSDYGEISSLNSTSLTKEEIISLLNFTNENYIIESKKGFISKLTFMDNILGYLFLEDIHFFEYINSYQKLFSTLVPIFGLLISNSRNFNQIVISETKLKDALATKNKFFSLIAHDLRSPLGVFNQFTQLLVDEYDLLEDEIIKDIISKMNSSSKTLFNLLMNLLDWAGTQTGRIQFNPGFFDLNLPIVNAVNTLNHHAKNKNIKIVTSIYIKQAVYFDLNMISTVLRNLISNAIKFSPKNSLIDITCFKKSDMIEFIVKDYGVGMNKKAVSKLFNLNYNESTKGTDNEKGSGLGLILCKEFVDMHKGRIWVETEDNKGSEFHFNFPYLVQNDKFQN